MGSGAVGGYFGGRLAQAGEDVAFVARGRQLAAMRERGLRIASPRGDLHLPSVRVTDDPAAIGPVDLVFFTVKLWSTEEAGRQIAPLIGPDTAVVSVQNGVEANDVLARAVGREHLMGGVCYIAASLDESGSVQHSGRLAVRRRGPPGPRRGRPHTRQPRRVRRPEAARRRRRLGTSTDSERLGAKARRGGRR